MDYTNFIYYKNSTLQKYINGWICYKKKIKNQISLKRIPELKFHLNIKVLHTSGMINWTDYEIPQLVKLIIYMTS